MSRGESVINRAVDFLFYLLAGTLCAFSLTLSAIAATDIEVPAATLLLFSVCFLAVLYPLFWNGRTVGILFIAIGVAVTGACIYLVFNKFEVAWFEQAADYVSWLLALSPETIEQHPEYAVPLSMLVAFLYALLLALCTRVYFNLWVPGLVGYLALTIPAEMEWGTDERALPLFLLGLLLLLCKKLNLHTRLRKKDKRAPGPAYTFLLVPLCLLVFGAAWALPKPEPEPESEGGGTRTDFLQSAEDFVQGVTPSRTLTFTEDGGRLGGPITMTDEFVMRVQSEEPVYLTGSVRDVYTGSSWQLGDDSREELAAESDGWFDTLDYPPEVAGPQEYYMRYYGRSVKALTIDIGSARTRTVYTPPFRFGVAFSGETSLSRNPYGQLRTGRSMPADTTYTQEYISWDYNNSYFINILQNMAANTVDVAAVKATMPEYLALPDSLPQRVRDLALSLTEGQGNDYDKLKALERHLAAFPYTLEPDYVPAGADFVDYFLFEGREGYCVYYASALTVMGRVAGIPTRYVEGFVMPKERSADGSYIVTNKQAHAWTEAYFPGFGWVRFEPTSSYFAEEYGEQPPEVEELPEEMPEETPEEPPDEAPDPLPEEEGSRKEPAIPSPEEEDGQSQAGGGLLPGILAGVATVLLSALFIRLLVSRYRTRAAQRGTLPNRESAVECFAGIVRAAEALGYPMEETETALAYARRVGGEAVFAGLPVPLAELAELFSRAAYSEGAISDDERDTMRRCYDTMLLMLRESPRHRLQYLFGRYVLLRF